jgi:antirestriction protein ArdC
MTDIYQRVTDTIIAAIEANPGEWKMPWNRAGTTFPTNALTGNAYNGVNVVTLWFVGSIYEHQTWATYKQWQELGCQVQKGQNGSPIIFYSSIQREEEDETKSIPFVKSSVVFNADQVDGYTPPVVAEMPPIERLANVDALVVNSQARVEIGGSGACYVPSKDLIRMPEDSRFYNGENRTEAYYSVLLHEMVHWTLPEHRVGRHVLKRNKRRTAVREVIDRSRYALEELVAELGSAFLCARLGVSKEVRVEHARYIDSWFETLKRDKMFIFDAAAQAQVCSDYLMQFAPPK